MRKIYSAALIALLTLLLLVGCSDNAEKSPEAAKTATPEKISFRLAWVPDMAEVGVFVAREKGFFADQGLDVTIEHGGFGLDPFKLVAAGTDDFGIGGAGNLLVAREQGLPLVAIAAEFQNTPVGFITHKGSGIQTFKDFSGKRVGIQTGADTDTLYRALLVENKMDSRDVSEIPIQYDMGPFVNNVIDVLPGYVTNQPITLRGQGFETNVITAASQGLRYYGNVFFTSEKKMKENPEQVARFCNAVRAGWEHALANKADALEALKKHTQEFSAEDLDAIYEAVMPFIRPDENAVGLLGMSGERWKTTEDVLQRAGILSSAGDISSAYTLRWVTPAARSGTPKE